MTYETYFPRGIAKGDAFCNREEERKRLIANMKSHHHTLIMSPRRYGKTSLVNYAADEMAILFSEADLFVAVDAKRVEQQILSGVKKMMGEVSTSLEQVLETIRNYFKKTSSKWTVGTQGINIALIPDTNHDPATTIMEALNALEDLLSKKKKHAVFFIDEIQEIGEVAEGKGIEGALRNVAQKTHYLSFIFSGSNRHLLANMFYDKARPLYKLCDRIILGRIDESHYKKHINKLSQKRWGKNLDDDAFKMLCALTERHPFYMNSLCFHLWDTDINQPPSPDEVKICWNKMIVEERREIMRELSSLSSGQKKVLIAIAEGNTKEFTGKIFLKKADIAGSSVTEALQILEQKDYIEKRESDGYRLIDPLIAAALRLYFSELDGL